MDNRSTYDIARLLAGRRWMPTNEAQLETAIGQALTGAGFVPEHQVVLPGGAGRIDIRVPVGEVRLGIEIKVQGSLDEVFRQIERYAGVDDLDELMLATTRRVHLAGMVDVIGGKNVHLVHLRGGGLG